MLCGSEADKAHIWRIANTDSLGFVFLLFISASCNGFFMSKTADPRIAADGLVVLMPMLDRLTRGTDYVGFLVVIFQTGQDLLQAFFRFHHGQERD